MEEDQLKTIERTQDIPDINAGKTELLPNEDETIRNSEHFPHESVDLSRTMNYQGTPSNDRTTSWFGKGDFEKKLNDELLDIPEVDPDDLEPENFSKLIRKPFTSKTDEEKIKINRNFLKDAEPFSLEQFVETLKNTPEGLFTGYAGLDESITIPQRRLTLVTGRPGHGKTAFMLNMMLNMCHKYPEKHFLYYTYKEPKTDIEIKLINMCGERPFSRIPGGESGINNNFSRWKYEFQNNPLPVIRDKAENDPEFKGLKNFLELSPRIHVIDSNYNVIELTDSVGSFNNTLSVGAVFIDYLQLILPEKSQRGWLRHQQLTEISNQLIEFGNNTKFPLIVAAQLSMPEKETPEYDVITLENLKELGDPEQMSNLIIGLQNYSRSAYIGSNLNDHFKSRFFDQPIKKAEKMPESFKNKHANTVLLVKVLENRNGPKPEIELLFNKWLMKVTDLKEDQVSKPNTPVN